MGKKGKGNKHGGGKEGGGVGDNPPASGQQQQQGQPQPHTQQQPVHQVQNWRQQERDSEQGPSSEVASARVQQFPGHRESGRGRGGVPSQTTYRGFQELGHKSGDSKQTWGEDKSCYSGGDYSSGGRGRGAFRRGRGRGGHWEQGEERSERRFEGRDGQREQRSFQGERSEGGFDRRIGQRGRGRGGRGDGRGRGQRGGPPSWQRDDVPLQEQQRYSPEPVQAPSPIQSSSSTSLVAVSTGGITASMSDMTLSPAPSTVLSEGSTGADGKQWIIPARKKTPTRCLRNIEIEVNHFLINLGKLKTVIHYDCAFEPDKISKKATRLVMEEVRRLHYSNRYPAFDGRKNLYSSGDIPLFETEELTTKIQLPPTEVGRDPFCCQVTIKKCVPSKVDMSLISKFLQSNIPLPQTPLQVLDIVLRNPSALSCTSVGRSFFTPPSRPYDLSNGMELWYGFYQSAVLGWKPLLNVDVAHKGFPEGKKVTLVMIDMKNLKRYEKRPTEEQLNRNGLNYYELENFVKHIKGLRIEFELPRQPTSRRKYRVNGVKEPCNRHSFKLDNGPTVTIEQYFRDYKQYKLKYPNLPCLHVGDPKKDICLPPELCKIIPGQVVMGKLNKIQTTNMIREAAKPPNERRQRIMDSTRNTRYNEDPCVREFGITVSKEFLKVPARILEAPSIEYGNMRVQVENGEWKPQVFKLAMTLNKWVIVSVSPFIGERDLSLIYERMRSVSSAVGMGIAEPRFDYLVPEQSRPLHESRLGPVLSEAFRRYKDNQVQMAVVVISDKAYGKVKLVAETEVGLLTQCILEKTLASRKMNDSTARNLLLKMNTKLNGINHTIIGDACRKSVLKHLQGTMLMGADVTHPSPDQKTIPSVAAVTASHDQFAFQYNMIWGLQPPRQEIIGNLEAIVIKQLQFYKTKNGVPPKRIIFYRDGVSEGQFTQVLVEEMTFIKSACRKEIGYELPVTFLVVQKRHHTRFFPAMKDADRNGNVPPGTVVDTIITHPRETDFYMVSHASLQGTSRPTKYHLLWDDNCVDEDDLEDLTYYLCHLFSRCTRTVSYPAPTYYAHLAAARGRVYLDGANIDLEKLALEMRRRTIKENIVSGSPMFFT